MDEIVQVMAWTFYFDRMMAEVPDEVFQLVVIKGVLCYKSLGLDHPKPVAKTGNKAFDDAVERAWQSYLFERNVLNPV